MPATETNSPSLVDSTKNLEPPQDGCSELHSHVSPIWQAAIDKYYEELRKGGVRSPNIDQDLWSVPSPDDLLQQIQHLTPMDPKTGSANWMGSLRRLKVILLNLNDFAAVIKFALKMDNQIATVIWGSIWLIFKFAQPVPPELLDMLEELGRALPRLRYEEKILMTATLEDALVATYTEIMVFCAHSITSFRNNPNITKSQNAWSRLSNDFAKDIAKLRHSSRLVDEEANTIRLSRKTNTAGTVDTMRSLHISQKEEVNLPCYMIPYGLNVRFFGRWLETDTLKRGLHPHDNDGHLKVIGIHGTGGVGKTQLALHYANTSRDIYEVVIWIPAKTQIKMTQALTRFATKLGLQNAARGSEDDHQSVQNVRDWLNTSGKTFLLIFDNVENHDLLDQIWPASTKGSVIITCRSLSLAAKRATEVMHLRCFSTETGVDVLHSLTGLKPSSKSDAEAAKELFQLLGGLPLAMVQISEFMNDRGYSYEELLPVYQKSAERIFARSGAPVQYEHTLDTVWDVSFECLSIESRALLNILAFFDPDLIPESILSSKRAGITDPNLQFLSDDLDFGDAVIGLTKASLVNRLSSHRALSIHRLVQLTVLSRLTTEEKSTFLDHAIRVLSCSFPNTLNEETGHQNHDRAAWETCSTILPHVNRLMALAQEHSIEITSPELFSELVFRAGTYLREKEQPTTAQPFFEFGLQLDIDPSAQNDTPAYRLPGHIVPDSAAQSSPIRISA